MATLITVRNAVREARIISLTQLSQKLTSDPQWLLILLDDLIRRGNVKRCETIQSCNQTCHGCQTSSQDVIFRWCDEHIAIANI